MVVDFFFVMLLVSVSMVSVLMFFSTTSTRSVVCFLLPLLFFHYRMQKREGSMLQRIIPAFASSIAMSQPRNTVNKQRKMIFCLVLII